MVADYFDNQALFWDIVYSESGDKIDSYYKYFMRKRKHTVVKILEDFKKTQTIKVLDAGCGSGVLVAELLGRGYDVIGIDISKNMVKETRKALKEENCTGENSNIVCNSDVENIPFKDGSFDAVVSVGVLQYLQHDSKCLNEYSRVVRHGGIIIVTFPNLFRLNNILDPYYYLVLCLQNDFTTTDLFDDGIG